MDGGRKHSKEFFPDLVEQLKLPDNNLSSVISPMPAPAPVNHLQPFTSAQDHYGISDSGRLAQSEGHAQSPRNRCIRSAEPHYRSYQQRGPRSQTPPSYQSL